MNLQIKVWDSTFGATFETATGRKGQGTPFTYIQAPADVFMENMGSIVVQPLAAVAISCAANIITNTIGNNVVVNYANPAVANGTLTGYGGGLERKRLLLDLESGVLPLVVDAARA